jgi:hypothetical protein
MCDQGAGQSHALTLPARQLRRVTALEARHLHQRQGLGDTTIGDVAADALHLQPELHIVVHSHVREQRIALKHHAKVALVHRRASDRQAVDQDLAAGRQHQARNATQQRGLAAAGRPQQCHELARFDRHVDRLQGIDGAEAVTQGTDVDHGAGRRACTGRGKLAGLGCHSSAT